MRSPNLPTDMLIAAAKEVETVHMWTADRFADHGVADAYQAETDALGDVVGELRRALHEFTEYSDGRPIEACVGIERGRTFGYVFKAVPEHRGERMLYEAPRPADPDEGDRGTYRVHVDDRAATVRVELLPPRRRRLGLVR
ncbi:hypothetical protein ACPXB3_00465 [Gordonia sp. DT219]|uniref:hypothetical protein n=1 Tax=Gordonia sp. DT219 TaxID=3416658 RepID=UPI003CF8F49F